MLPLTKHFLTLHKALAGASPDSEAFLPTDSRYTVGPLQRGGEGMQPGGEGIRVDHGTLGQISFLTV